MQANQNSVITTVIIAGVILLVALIIAASSINGNLKLVADGLNDINVPTTESVVSGILAGITIPEAEVQEIPEYIMNEDEYEAQTSEDKAEELATEYLEDKDFLEDLAFYLDSNDFLNIDEDDLSIKILDSKTYYPGNDEYIVTFDIKVY